MNITMYVVRQKSTGRVMPLLPTNRGYTQLTEDEWVLPGMHVPRLFATYKAAALARGRYVLGPCERRYPAGQTSSMFDDDGDCSLVTDSSQARDPDNYEVLPVEVVFP